MNLDIKTRNIKTAKNDCFHCCSEEYLSENDFEAVLATFCCHDYGANAFEAVEKMATNQEDYNKCSLCVIVCCIAKSIISNSKKVAYRSTSGDQKNPAEVTQKKKQ